MCDVCENGKPIYYNNDKVLKFDVSIKKNNLIVDFPNLYHVISDINHCPNCGRFLGENKPLTMKELDALDICPYGKPIFIKVTNEHKGEHCNGWYIAPCDLISHGFNDIDYSKTWTAFRYEVME